MQRSGAANCPNRRSSLAGARVSARPQDRGPWPGFLRSGRGRRHSPRRSRAFSIGDGRSASASATSMKRDGKRISAASSRCPTISLSRSRCAITGTSSGCTTRRSATAAASPSRNSGMMGSGCSTLAPGLGADALQPPRRRPADAQRRGARSARDRDARGARGGTSKSFALFETGEPLERGDEPSPTRSAVLTRLSHGHIRIGTFQRLAFLGEGPEFAQARPLLPRQSLRRAGATIRCALFDLVAQATATLAAPISLRASSTACSTATISISPARASIMGRGALRPIGTWISPPRISIITAFIPSARQPEATHWDLAQLGGCAVADRRSAHSADLLAGWGERFEAALAPRCSGALALRRRWRVSPRADQALASREAPTDRFFFDWRGGRDPGVELYPSHPRSARSPPRSRVAALFPTTHIGRTRRPARCTSRRSRRSGRRSRTRTTGSRSRTRLERSGEWARRWSRMQAS